VVDAVVTAAPCVLDKPGTSQDLHFDDSNGLPKGRRLIYNHREVEHRRLSVTTLCPLFDEICVCFSGVGKTCISQACPCGRCAADAVINRLRIFNSIEPDKSMEKPLLREIESILYKSLDRAPVSSKLSLRSNLVNVIETTFSGEKKKHYEHGLSVWDACGNPEFNRGKGEDWGLYFGTFVKNEAVYPSELFAKKGVEVRPRAINPQVVELPACYGGGANLLSIGLELAALQPINQGRKQLTNEATKIPIFTSGLTLFGSGEAMVQFDQLGDYVFHGFDAVGYDGCQKMLAPVGRKAFKRVMSEVFDKDPLWNHFCQVLDAQENAELRAPGLIAEIDGIRASGTGGTGPFNQMMFVSALRCSTREAGIDPRSCLYLSAGDDTIYGLPRKHLEKVPEIMKNLTRLGLEIDLQQVSNEARDLDFCRMRVLSVKGRYTLVKSPRDVLNKISSVLFKTGSLQADAAYMVEVCNGYNGLWRDVPFVGPMVRAIGRIWQRLAATAKSTRTAKSDWLFQNVSEWNLEGVDNWDLADMNDFTRVYGVTETMCRDWLVSLRSERLFASFSDALRRAYTSQGPQACF